MKLKETTFGFLDNNIWIGCTKFSLKWWEYLSSAVILLKNTPKIPDVTKKNIFQLNSSLIDQPSE